MNRYPNCAVTAQSPQRYTESVQSLRLDRQVIHTSGQNYS